jgi:hypothetical protein
VVADRAAIVREHVHGGHHRVGVALPHAAPVGHEVAERRALDQVAVVEQQAVRRLRPGGPDERRRAGEPDRVVGGVAVIVVREDVHVQVGGLQDPQPHERGALRERAARERGGGCGGGAGLEGAAAGQARHRDGPLRGRAPGVA